MYKSIICIAVMALLTSCISMHGVTKDPESVILSSDWQSYKKEKGEHTSTGYWHFSPDGVLTKWDAGQMEIGKFPYEIKKAGGINHLFILGADQGRVEIYGPDHWRLDTRWQEPFFARQFFYPTNELSRK